MKTLHEIASACGGGCEFACGERRLALPGGKA